MRHNIHGGVRISVVVSKSVGFHPTHEGERQRKTLRGNVITEDIVQVNMKVVEKAKKAERPKKAKKVKAEATEAEKVEAPTEQTEPTKPEEAAEAETEVPKVGGESSEEAAQAT
jgi:hypothetical protein